MLLIKACQWFGFHLVYRQLHSYDVAIATVCNFTTFTVFIPFRSCYYLLYQCLVPNTREALSLLVLHYSVPRDFERSILSGKNPRVGNQGILNYLLIVLRRDKDLGKFWKIIKSMVNQPKLEEAIKQVQKGIHIRNAECNIYIYIFFII